MKKVNFNALKSIEPPNEWVEKALAAQHKKKPLPLRPYILGTAASAVIVLIAAVTLLHSGGGAPFSPKNTLPVLTAVSGTTAPPGNGEAYADAAATLPKATEAPPKPDATAAEQQAEYETAAPATAAQTDPPQPAVTKTHETQPSVTQPASISEEPTEAFEPWQPLETMPPEPPEPGIGDPDLPATYPPQPLWYGKIEIEILSTSRFFNSSSVYIHLHDLQTEEEPVPVYSESGRMTFSYAGSQKKTVEFHSGGLIRQYDQYHAMIYDQRGQAEDIYFCVRPDRVDRVTPPETITFQLE